MIPLYIVGVGGAAKEILQLFLKKSSLSEKYIFQGLIDVGITQHTICLLNQEYIVFNEDWFFSSQVNEQKQIAVLFAIGTPKILSKVISKYKIYKNIVFPNLIDSDIDISGITDIGQGNIIAQSTVVTVDVIIGDFNYINRGVQIGHDVTIGNSNVINPSSVISGGVVIGNQNLLGTNSTILQYCSIGNQNIIGASALVLKDISKSGCYIGIPAKQKLNE